MEVAEHPPFFIVQGIILLLVGLSAPNYLSLLSNEGATSRGESLQLFFISIEAPRSNHNLTRSLSLSRSIVSTTFISGFCLFW
jgi:hypothetical protein